MNNKKITVKKHGKCHDHMRLVKVDSLKSKALKHNCDMGIVANRPFAGSTVQQYNLIVVQFNPPPVDQFRPALSSIWFSWLTGSDQI